MTLTGIELAVVLCIAGWLTAAVVCMFMRRWAGFAAATILGLTAAACVGLGPESTAQNDTDGAVLSPVEVTATNNNEQE